MRISMLFLLFGVLVSCSLASAGDGLRLQMRGSVTPKLVLNANGEVVRGEGNEFVVETDKEKNVLLAVKVNDSKRYLSYSGAKDETPKIILVERPDENSRWLKQETIPRQKLRMDSPAWGSTQFLAATGHFTNRVLASGEDKKLLLLMPSELNDKLRPLVREILWDNLNDGK